MCGIVEFLKLRQSEMSNVLAHLKQIPEAKKSAELQRAENFIGIILENADGAAEMEPCLTVGDLMIAMDSDTFLFSILLTVGKASIYVGHLNKPSLCVPRIMNVKT